ncbi:MAG: 1,6-anhydro-N-acetylmuramyl-L-alanine amidase AmpD [bacterium]|jgi:AmpD protein
MTEQYESALEKNDWSGGWWQTARKVLSPNCDERPPGCVPELIVLHNISLPPEDFTTDAVEQFFTNQLSAEAHPYFAAIADMRVSAHFFVRRDGTMIQFVDCDKRAWHAGVSQWQGRSGCNDFSIGIEIEGSDYQSFEQAQYQTVLELIRQLCVRYPVIGIAGHEHIAPGRKTDPGPHWDWKWLRTHLNLSEDCWPV